MTDEQARIIGEEIGKEIAATIRSQNLWMDALRLCKNSYSEKSAIEQLGEAIGRGMKNG